MTATLSPSVPVSPVRPGRAGLPQVLRSEWTKLWSVRSTTWSLLALAVATVGFSALFCWGTAANFDQLDAGDLAAFDATSLSLAGLVLGQLGAAVLGVLVISSEYSTGGIRTSLVAVPRRTRLVVAKALVLVVVTLVVGTLSCLVSFLVGQALLRPTHLQTTLGTPHVLRAVLGGGLYVAGSALFGFALGTLLRHTPGAIVATVAGLLVVPPLTQLLPGGIGDSITKWFTSNAGQQITSVHQGPDVASPWTGYFAFTAWWAVILVAGVVLLRRRDA